MHPTRTIICLSLITTLGCQDPCYLGLEGSWDFTMSGELEGLGTMDITCNAGAANPDYPYLVSGSFEAAPYSGEFTDLPMAAWGWLSENLNLPSDAADVVHEHSAVNVSNLNLKGNPYGGEGIWAIHASSGWTDGEMFFE